MYMILRKYWLIMWQLWRFCTDKTKSPAPNGAGDFYRLIVGLVRCTLGSSVADLQRICTTKLLLDLCNNTHLGLFVCLDRHSHQTLVRLFYQSSARRFPAESISLLGFVFGVTSPSISPFPPGHSGISGIPDFLPLVSFSALLRRVSLCLSWLFSARRFPAESISLQWFSSRVFPRIDINWHLNWQ